MCSDTAEQQRIGMVMALLALEATSFIPQERATRLLPLAMTTLAITSVSLCGWYGVPAT
jgi:hypothetical protein